MKEDVTLGKDVEKAIIMCFRSKPDEKLRVRAIGHYVKKYVRISDQNLAKKIERMAKKGYLLWNRREEEKGFYLYYLNPDFNFILEDTPLEQIKPLDNNATDDRRKHSLELKEAIHTCIDNLSEPSSASICTASSVIAACESHLLFSDLSNHLPELGIDVTQKWINYKISLIKLDKLKVDILSSLKMQILKCFKGLNLHFVYDDDQYQSYADYDFTINPELLYKIIIAMLEDDTDEGYNNHLGFLSWLQDNAPIVEKGDHVLWGEAITYLRLPKKDRALLEAGIPRFIAFIENIEISEIFKKAQEIQAEVDALMKQRECLLSELKDMLHYSSYPGDCKYLK